jgi:hypothetical protein
MALDGKLFGHVPSVDSIERSPCTELQPEGGRLLRTAMSRREEERGEKNPREGHRPITLALGL